MTDTALRVCAVTHIVAGLAMGTITLEEDRGVLLEEKDFDLLEIAIKMEDARKRLARYRENPLQLVLDSLVVIKNALEEEDNPFEALDTWLAAELSKTVLDFHIN
jgi:hypothetical protein